MLEGETTYTEKDGVFYTSCNTRPANIEILIQGMDSKYWIQFSGTDMIINTEVGSSQEQLCIYNWLPNKDDFWVFGQAFYTDYYVIHEPLEGKIGIVPTER